MVFVLNKSKKPLDMISHAKARILLKNRLAVVHKIYPFTIRLRDNSCGSQDRAYTVKIDPGSRHTGIAVVDDKDQVVMLAEIEHRGYIIKRSLDSRRAVRRSRRNRKTRYRPARFLNRTKPKGWLAPSVKSRADNVVNFIKKYKKFLNINKVMIENVSFDTAQMALNTKLWGNAYQQGPLYQNKLRSFIFNRSNNKCVYCGAKATEIDHIIPRAKGGTNSTYNLVASCRACNQMKSNLTLKAFGKMMNKDYLSVGEVPNKFNFLTNKILLISAKGRGSRQMCRMDKYGFPRTSAKVSKSVRGFQTGDIVRARVTEGLKKRTYLGRVAVRSTGYFDIQTKTKTIEGIGYKYCRIIQRGDGYLYSYKE